MSSDYLQIMVDDPCLICSGKTGNHLGPYNNKIVERTIDTIFKYLIIPRRNLNFSILSSSKSFCPTCSLIVEEIVKLQEQIDVLELLIKRTVERLGEIVFKTSKITSERTSIDEVPSSEAWNKFRKLTVKNYLEGLLPNPSVRLGKQNVMYKSKSSRRTACRILSSRNQRPGPLSSKRKITRMKLPKVIGNSSNDLFDKVTNVKTKQTGEWNAANVKSEPNDVTENYILGFEEEPCPKINIVETASLQERDVKLPINNQVDVNIYGTNQPNNPTEFYLVPKKEEHLEFEDVTAFSPYYQNLSETVETDSQESIVRLYDPPLQVDTSSESMNGPNQNPVDFYTPISSRITSLIPEIKCTKCSYVVTVKYIDGMEPSVCQDNAKKVLDVHIRIKHSNSFDVDQFCCHKCDFVVKVKYEDGIERCEYNARKELTLHVQTMHSNSKPAKPAKPSSTKPSSTKPSSKKPCVEKIHIPSTISIPVTIDRDRWLMCSKCNYVVKVKYRPGKKKEVSEDDAQKVLDVHSYLKHKDKDITNSMEQTSPPVSTNLNPNSIPCATTANEFNQVIQTEPIVFKIFLQQVIPEENINTQNSDFRFN